MACSPAFRRRRRWPQLLLHATKLLLGRRCRKPLLKPARRDPPLPLPLPHSLPGRPTERTRKLTYAAVMEHEWGRWAGLAVRFSIVVGSAGFLVLYLIVLADLLVGAPLAAGVGLSQGHACPGQCVDLLVGAPSAAGAAVCQGGDMPALGNM